jgi:predicted ATPase/DNA-binding SARP family transcriptional activator
MVDSGATAVRLLGRPAVRDGTAWVELPPGKSSAIVLYLAVAGGWVGRDALGYLFWPDEPQARARSNLRALTWRLAHAPHTRRLERERTRLRWPVATDVADARRAFDEADWYRAWSLAREELLAEFSVPEAPEFERWLEAERSDLRDLARRAGLRAIETCVEVGDLEAAVEVAGALHRSDPLDEMVLRTYLVTLARTGERNELLAVYDRFRRELVDELEVEPEEATIALVETLRTGTANAAVAAPGAGYGRRGEVAPPGVIPVQPTRFVGRVRELAAVGERLREDGCRLLTIVGPGGVGKTRLAIELAAGLTAESGDRARFVDLATVGTLDGMVMAIARAVGVTEPVGGDAAEHLLRQLGQREMLLVLDNLEHLVDHRGLIADIMARAAGVRILATSRVRLALRGERLFDLAGMHVASEWPGDEPPDAVTLFVRCARRVRPDLALEPGELRCVARIGALVEGLPLALELAATWLRVLTIEAIETELRLGVRLLEVADHGPSERHAGIRAVFDHSWSLLRPRERAALRALAVFRGGWTREAAADVANVDLPVLLSLVDASLVRRDASGRFTWHPLVGQFAAGRAAEESDEHDAVADRHARHFLAFVAAREADRHALDGGSSLALADADMPNIQAAWRCMVMRHDEAVLAAACHGLWAVCFASNRLRLLQTMLRDALTIATPGGVLRGRAAVWLGCTLCQGSATVDMGRAIVSREGLAFLEEGVAIAARRGADADLARGLQELGVAYGLAGRRDESQLALRRATAVYRSLGDDTGVAAMTSLFAEFEPAFATAVEGFRSAIEVATEAGVPFPLMMASEGVASRLLLGFGAYREAAAALERHNDLCRRMGFEHWANHGRLEQAYIEASAGALRAASDLLAQSLDGTKGTVSDDAERYVATATSLRGWIAAMEGDAVVAADACRRALAAPEGALRPAAAVRSMTVLAALALASRDLDGATDWLGRARTTLVEVQRLAFGKGSVPAADVPLWLRMLTVEVDLALAGADLNGAYAVAIEALTIAGESDQQPAAALALAAAARTLAAGDQQGDARALAGSVLRHPATPFDAILAARQLDAGDAARRPRSARWDDTYMHDRTLFTTLDRTRARLRQALDRRGR